MNKLLFLFIFPIVVLSSCIKSNDYNPTPVVSPAEQAIVDDAAIQTYLAAHTDIHALKDTSGIYYQVITAGTGSFPVAAATIKVNYKGSILNGAQFDQGTNFSAVLKNLIPGWQLGLPHVAAGGRILLIIPSRYGYGSVNVGAIPANSVLVFTIDLLSTSNSD
jgi:FKBP-type peptidyl-prolyl cis-trans isomerase FkpA